MSDEITTAPPLYLQISETLVRQIAGGRLVEGERLPPERQLARLHGVAVGTLRRALDDLVARGLIERRHGSGNYVRALRDSGGLYGFFRLELTSGGGLPDAETIGVTLDEAPAGSGFGPAHRMRRLRKLDGCPVALEQIWLDAAWAQTLPPQMPGPALYREYLEAFGLRIVRVEDRVGIGSIPAWGAAALGLLPGAPCGRVERRAWGQAGAPAEVSTTWFDPDRAHYVQRM